MDKIPLTCKNCGFDAFKAIPEAKSLDEYCGSICPKCGTALSEDDIKSQILKIANEHLRDAFGKSRIK